MVSKKINNTFFKKVKDKNKELEINIDKDKQIMLECYNELCELKKQLPYSHYLSAIFNVLAKLKDDKSTEMHSFYLASDIISFSFSTFKDVKKVKTFLKSYKNNLDKCMTNMETLM